MQRDILFKKIDKTNQTILEMHTGNKTMRQCVEIMFEKVLEAISLGDRG